MPCFCKNKVIAKQKLLKDSILITKEKKVAFTQIFILKRKF